MSERRINGLTATVFLCGAIYVGHGAMDQNTKAQHAEPFVSEHSADYYEDNRDVLLVLGGGMLVASLLFGIGATGVLDERGSQEREEEQKPSEAA